MKSTASCHNCRPRYKLTGAEEMLSCRGCGQVGWACLPAKEAKMVEQRKELGAKMKQLMEIMEKQRGV